MGIYAYVRLYLRIFEILKQVNALHTKYLRDTSL